MTNPLIWEGYGTEEEGQHPPRKRTEEEEKEREK
jgi:hypothetical protein